MFIMGAPSCGSISLHRSLRRCAPTSPWYESGLQPSPERPSSRKRSSGLTATSAGTEEPAMGYKRITRGNTLIGKGSFTIIAQAVITYDPPSLTSNTGVTSADQTVPGAAVGDF